MAWTDQSGDWSTKFAPTLAELQSLAIEAYAHMPEEFRALCGDIIIEVVDFPDDQIVEDLDLETPFDILCLFEGSGLGERFHLKSREGPDRLMLFRRAILDYWSENEETLGDIVSHILLYEIGQHFGLSESEMERLEVEH